MSEGFAISVRHLPDHSTISCTGALDLLPAEKLRYSVTSAVDRGCPKLILDCSEVTLLTSAGITALVDSAIKCKEEGVVLELRLSSHVRRILDLVGLWWLGVVEDGISVHTALQRALRSYADQAFAGTLTAPEDDARKTEGDGNISLDS